MYDNNKSSSCARGETEKLIFLSVEKAATFVAKTTKTDGIKMTAPAFRSSPLHHHIQAVRARRAVIFVHKFAVARNLDADSTRTSSGVVVNGCDDFASAGFDE